MKGPRKAKPRAATPGEVAELIDRTIMLAAAGMARDVATIIETVVRLEYRLTAVERKVAKK